jgi:MFS family permease
VAPVLPRLVARFGLRAMVLSALVTAGLTLAVFPFVPWTALWFPLRFLLGGAATVLFTASDTWVTRLCHEKGRGRTMAIYSSSLSLGFALGPMIVAFTGFGDATPYLVGAALVLTASLVTLSPGLIVPAFERTRSAGSLRFFRRAPIAMLAVLLNAGLQVGGLSFLPLYAIAEGWTKSAASVLASILLLGAILLQFPIGWLADKMDRRRLMTGLGLVCGLVALTWPLIFHIHWLVFGVVFVWGGLIVGIYTVMQALVGSRFQGSDLVGVYAAIGITWGIGGLFGPPLLGAAMGLIANGFPFMTGAMCLAFAGFLALTRSKA